MMLSVFPLYNDFRYNSFAEVIVCQTSKYFLQEILHFFCMEIR